MSIGAAFWTLEHRRCLTRTSVSRLTYVWRGKAGPGQGSVQSPTARPAVAADAQPPNVARPPLEPRPDGSTRQIAQAEPPARAA